MTTGIEITNPTDDITMCGCPSGHLYSYDDELEPGKCPICGDYFEEEEQEEEPAMTTATKTHHAYRYTITEDSWGMRVYSVYLRNSDGNGLVRVAFVDTPQEMQAFVERNCGPGDTWSLINEDS